MRRILIASSFCLVGALGCGSGGGNAPATSTAEEEVEHFARISVADVATGLAAPDHRLAVFDANDRETFDERHVPGATWVDYDGVTREQLPSDTSTPLVFYCYNEACSASHVAAESAIAMGFPNVSVMGAGITGWVAAGNPVEPLPAAAAEGETATQ